MKIAIGNDHSAVEMKNMIVEYLTGKGYEMINLGTDSTESYPYPTAASNVANAVVNKEADCGITVVPDNVDALAEGFRKFAAMGVEEQNRLGKNSRIFAESKLMRQSNLPKVIDALLNAKK